jgi:hypothetical protein
VVAGNPLKNIHDLAKVQMTFSAGKRLV